MIALATHAVCSGGVKPLVLEITMGGAGTFTLPCVSGGTYNAIIDWDDNTTRSTITTYNDADLTHSYSGSGTYNIKIFGLLPHIYFNNGGDKSKVTDIVRWGDWQPASLEKSFYGCSNLVGKYTDSLDLSNCTTMLDMFKGCTSFNGNVLGWNTSTITIMQSLFNGCTSFNKNVGGLNVSACADFNSMFLGATLFNNGGSSDINNWTLKTTLGANISIANMFRSTAFNQPLNNWNTSEVTLMNNMFQNNTVFNQDISGWNTAKVTSITSMFASATTFNRNIGLWDISALTAAVSCFESSGMNTANYTDTIVAWANFVNTNSFPKSVSMGTETGRVYTNARSGGAGFANAGAARTYLTGVLPDGGWTISGDTVI